MTSPRRAAAMAPDERRRAICEAAVPLLLEHGAAVTTRQIAEAAGVAEGTLFRVFDDKAALLHAAAHAVLDPERTRRALAGVDADLPLEEMVRTVAAHLLVRSRQVMTVMMAVRSLPSAERPDHGPGHRSGPPPAAREAHRELLHDLAGLFARYSDQLRVEPERAALLLRALVFGARQPWAEEAQTLTADEVAAVLLGGVLVGRDA